REMVETATAAWGKLTRVVTPEIMNTMTAITSISESVLNDIKAPHGESPAALNEDHMSTTITGLEVIREQGRDLMEFVQSYRSLLSLPKPNKSIVSVQKRLGKVNVLMDQEDRDGAVHFTIGADPTDLELFIDEKQISQILVNLGKNALHSLKGQENGQIKIIAGINDKGIKYIRITDNGPGVPPDLIDEIFIPFFTTKNTGTGIGLSLSKQIMHLHGGTIKVHSAPYTETSFMLSFQ